jgi:hypothetical protein
MSRHRCAKSTAWIGSLIYAAGNLVTAGIVHGQDHYDTLVPFQGEVEIELFRQATGHDKGTPIPVEELGNIICLGEQNGRYHIRSSTKGEGWVPTWELEKSGPRDTPQQFLRPPADLPASIAVSPHQAKDETVTAPLPGQSPKIENLFRKGDEPPSPK